MNKYRGYGILNMNQMPFKIFGHILDKATLWTVLDGHLPNFLDIGQKFLETGSTSAGVRIPPPPLRVRVMKKVVHGRDLGFERAS